MHGPCWRRRGDGAGKEKDGARRMRSAVARSAMVAVSGGRGKPRAAGVPGRRASVVAMSHLSAPSTAALRAVLATRYVLALREGGSLPGLVEADDDGMYVVKFTGAGQGRKALVAEVICARLAGALGLRVPELVLVEVDPRLGLTEPDQEVQDLLRASPGPNLGVDYLPGALGFDAAVDPVDARTAAAGAGPRRRPARGAPAPGGGTGAMRRRALGRR